MNSPTTNAPGDADEAVRAELARAFKELCPRMVEHARQDADLDPTSRVADFSDAEVQQFVNAFEKIFHEALSGSGRQTRELIFDTALPPIRALGLTTQDMIRSNLISAVMLTHRLLPMVAAERRHAAARWLATFHSEYAYELLGRLQALEATAR
jgi:hypothetical protein